MKKGFFKIMFITLILLTVGVGYASATSPIVSDNVEIKEKNMDKNNMPLQSVLAEIDITGGISAGYFYASNPGEDTEEDAFLLSNLLVEISTSDEELPIGFTGAFGETSTHSILGTPENNTDFDIEYASLTLRPVKEMSFEIGLLQPNAGYENTYTYNNKNILLGATASQQPYNAYGARIGYDVNGLCLWGGYFRERLDDEEYNSPDSAWEIGLSTPVGENTLSLYHYNIKDQRSVSGAVIERTINDIDLALNIDYWRWSNPMNELYESHSSFGGAFYICPNFGNFSIPLRLEYINQKNSQIFIENPDTKDIYTVTVSPTWHYNENTYIRAEAAYVKADGGFVDEDGRIRDNRINCAIELGFTF
jgi:hypothetical protein